MVVSWRSKSKPRQANKIQKTKTADQPQKPKALWKFLPPPNRLILFFFSNSPFLSWNKERRNKQTVPIPPKALSPFQINNQILNSLTPFHPILKIVSGLFNVQGIIKKYQISLHIYLRYDKKNCFLPLYVFFILVIYKLITSSSVQNLVFAILRAPHVSIDCFCSGNKCLCHLVIVQFHSD